MAVEKVRMIAIEEAVNCQSNSANTEHCVSAFAAQLFKSDFGEPSAISLKYADFSQTSGRRKIECSYKQRHGVLWYKYRATQFSSQRLIFFGRHFNIYWILHRNGLLVIQLTGWDQSQCRKQVKVQRQGDGKVTWCLFSSASMESFCK